ncbi:YqhG family protein [Fervidibacillus halotolerans]|uniref:YqhG family protein n=1 Tax=Fervidibacillus halotolerans TaxID=2980027 RepID=A0A9E8LXE5_9BACI|nr:YqhG family protein [Fervidibacillus halotolerans]WAA11442.1 YqhG family protein [Fervidibacillus halotolerans]
MQQQEIRQFLKRFFDATQCKTVQDDGNAFTVQLTVDMDKALMNRPFYWHYIEKTRGTPNPQKITFLTDFSNSNESKGEKIHFGSPRLHQIFQLTKKLGGFIRMFEDRPGTVQNHTPLIPWLCMNIKVSYICDRKKDEFHSIGLNLINGKMLDNFHYLLKDTSMPLSMKMPDFAFTFTPLIKPVSGIKRIEQYIRSQLQQEDHTWAMEAKKRWERDEKLLNIFFEEWEEKPEQYEIEKEALREQYEPKISVDCINGGIFYLTKDRFR